ncbi:MAG: iron-containing alcohol dehydrogenase [Candidatus Riflebacteria bacterium]|nr:iron-containing alcohol dehydrogenase [Candidatus Riflebacteria bacterium]
MELFVSPSQYVQGSGVLDSLEVLLTGHAASGVGVVITPGRHRALGDRAGSTLAGAGLRVAWEQFRGESTVAEADRLAGALREAAHPVELVIAVGGGKCLNAGRMAASRLGIRVMTVPTTASTDAPTAAHSVIYDQDGAFVDMEFSLTNPLLVLVDLDIVAAAPAARCYGPLPVEARTGRAYSSICLVCNETNPPRRQEPPSRPFAGSNVPETRPKGHWKRSSRLFRPIRSSAADSSGAGASIRRPLPVASPSCHHADRNTPFILPTR